MLRFRLRFTALVSAVPLIAGAIFAGVEAFESPRACIAIGDNTPDIASAPWHADLHVDPTDVPSLATVRVGADSAQEADFAVIDDSDGREQNGCAITPVTQFVAVSARPSASVPVIYLSHQAAADQR